tara:strand:- start:1016 stop:2365 length:1350 start_codon:yes stop_codon:yes gene_type:complete
MPPIDRKNDADNDDEAKFSDDDDEPQPDAPVAPAAPVVPPSEEEESKEAGADADAEMKDAPAAGDAANPSFQLSNMVKELATNKLQEHVNECNDELTMRNQQKLERKECRLADIERAKRVRDDANAKFERWTEISARYSSGISRDPDEEIQKIDCGDEVAEEATEFWDECNEDMDTMRDNFPLHAEMWWGPPPTEDQIKEAEDAVAEAEDELRDATQALTELTEKPLDSDGEDGIDEYDEEDAPAAGKGKGKAKAKAPSANETPAAKRKRERAEKLAAMTPEERELEKAKQCQKDAETTRKRQATATEKKMKIDAYPRLKKFEKGYKRALSALEGKEEELEKVAAESNRAKQAATKAQQKTRVERDLFVEWLNLAEGKGKDYDAKKAMMHFSRWYKMKNEEEKAASASGSAAKGLPSGNYARKSAGAGPSGTPAAKRQKSAAAAGSDSD